MKTALILILLSVLVACVPAKSVNPNSSSGNINASAPYLWTSYSGPKDLLISVDFIAAEVTNITDMSTAWETAIENKKDLFSHTVRTPEVSSPTLDLDSLGDDNVNGVYKITHWPTSLPGSALAVTQIFGRRFNIGKSSEYVRIEHADILINDNFYNFRTGNGGGGFDLQTVILHEMGHYLGLPHKTGNTIMVASIDASDNIRAPTSIDKADIATKYSLTMSTMSGSAMVAEAAKTYAPEANDSGKQIKLLIELHADGDCVHRENGAVISRHSAKH
jgi:hypothetical protein